MSKVRTLIDWDYDGNIATQWERLGECNQCARCCIVQIEMVAMSQEDARDGGYSTDETGLWHEIEEGGIRRYFKIKPIVLEVVNKGTCLSEDNKTCKYHDDPHRSLICTGFPFSPRNIELFPECSFWFRPLTQWEIEPVVVKAVIEEAIEEIFQEV